MQLVHVFNPHFGRFCTGALFKQPVLVTNFAEQLSHRIAGIFLMISLTSEGIYHITEHVHMLKNTGAELRF